MCGVRCILRTGVVKVRSTCNKEIGSQWFWSSYVRKREDLLFGVFQSCTPSLPIGWHTMLSLLRRSRRDSPEDRHGQQCNVSYRKPGQDLPGSNPVVSHFFTLFILYIEAQNYSSCFLFSKTNGV